MTTINNQNATLNSIANALVYNNDYRKDKTTATQIGADTFKEWKTVCDNLRRSAYTVYAYLENNALQDIKSVPADLRNPVYKASGLLLDACGTVNNHRLYITDNFINLVVGYAGKRGDDKKQELLDCESTIRKLSRSIADLKEMQGIEPEHIANLESQLDELKGKKDELYATAEMCVKVPTIVKEDAFRFDLERLIARAIKGQQAKSLEQLDKEAEERKAARKAAAKARKQAKANANA